MTSAIKPQNTWDLQDMPVTQAVHHLRSIAILIVCVIALGLFSPGQEATPSGPVLPRNPAPDARLFGASTPTDHYLNRIEGTLDRRLGAVRLFRRWGEPMVDDQVRQLRREGRQVFLSVKSLTVDGQAVPFRDVATARPGDPVYREIAAQAREVRSLGQNVFVTYNHEPEGDIDVGTTQQFVAAWRNWVSIYREKGALNAQFTWITTGFGYTHNGPRSAPRFWPGRAWVDVIGIDAYNSYRCTNPSGRWTSPAQMLEPALDFARRYPKVPVVLTEWSSVEDPANPARKGRWIRELDLLLRQPQYDQIVGVLQWGGRYTFDHGGPGTGCTYAWSSSPGSISALKDMSQDPFFAGAQVPDIWFQRYSTL